MEEFTIIEELSIDGYKEYLLNIIDNKTEKAIFEGFTFDSKLFSMSLSAQINWSNLFFIPDEMFPLAISTKGDEETYNLSLANRANFYGSALVHKNTALQTGTYLKNQVKACTTIGELEIIKDSL